MPGHQRDHPAGGQRHVHRRAGEEAGREDRAAAGRAHVRALGEVTARGGSAWPPDAAQPRAAAGDHQDPVVHPDHVHVLAVQLAEHLGADHLVGGPAGGPAVRHVHDPVHDRQQRVHVVGRDQHRDLLLAGDPAEQFDHVLLAGDVQVGQRLVEQEQPGTADQRVRDQHPLLLAAGQEAHPRVGEPVRAHGLQHLVDHAAAPGRRQRDAEPLPVQSQADQVAGAQRHVRVEQDLLRDVADQRAAPGTRLARHADRARLTGPAGRG